MTARKISHFIYNRMEFLFCEKIPHRVVRSHDD